MPRAHPDGNEDNSASYSEDSMLGPVMARPATDALQRANVDLLLHFLHLGS